MNSKSILGVLLAVLALVTSACEETVDITDAVYRERLVVYGVLEPDEPVAIRFTRTLPINEPYSDERAYVSDVAATITAEAPDGATERTTLVYGGDGEYSAPDLIAREGYRYTLQASWRGKSINGRTTIPQAPVVDSVGLVPIRRQYDDMEFPDTMYTTRAVIVPRQETTYLMTTAIVDPRTGRPTIHDTYGGAPLKRMRDTNGRGRLELVDEWGFFDRRESLSAVIVSYDEQYYEFQRTYYNSGDHGPFGSGSDTVWWTVEGDGIGLFIGRRTDIYRVQ
jgi:hypothetical protein